MSDHGTIPRRLPAGAEILPSGGAHFRVWAPRRRKVEVVFEDGAASPLSPEGNGYFSALVPGAAAGSLYRYRLDGGDSFPDPMSRFQPQGPHGPSQVVDPNAYAWNDRAWRGARLAGQAVSEIHVGTFTREGTWNAAAQKLPLLADTGITAIEVMPVADFPGEFGWGYDGVNLYAPARLYGTPDDFRRFVDAAHAAGIAVILDVVYNHLGPDGCYLREFSVDYFTKRYENEWGEPINFAGPGCEGVREYFVSNAGYWIDEFHLDGLRLDATQQIFDASPVNVMQEITARVRQAGGARATLVVAENEPQDVKLVRDAAQGGYGMDALWNDDLHHAATVALTGHGEAYYSDYAGAPQEFISAVKHGYLYQGQRYQWQKKRRGTPALDIAAPAFIAYIQNHDQVANSACGTRIHSLSHPGRLRALTALVLLSPATPMLFQGQEFAASSPFLYFADHHPELAAAVRNGRKEFMRQFASIAQSSALQNLADPGSRATFERCKLDWSERERHAEALALHRDLLRLRREDAVFASQGAHGVDGAVLGARAFVLRFFGEAGDDRLILVNLAGDLLLPSAPEPLLAPPWGHEWRTLWSSEDARYCGAGTSSVDTKQGWRIPGEAAVVLTPGAVS